MYKLLSLILALSFLACAPIHMEAGTSKTKIKSDYYLLSYYPAVNNIHVVTYLKNLSSKLFITSDSCLKDPLPQILKASIPFALLSDSGTIYLSTALINALHSEAELAFILLHEFAHAYWCHPPCDLDNQNSNLILENELQADAFALENMILHGYNANASYSALTHAYLENSAINSSVTHPDLTRRVKNLSKRNKQLHPPSVSLPFNNDSFMNIKKILEDESR